MICPSVEENRKVYPPAFNSEENDFVGNEAYQKVTSILHGYPLAQRLAGEVYGFYGDHLRYRESRNFTSTIFTIRLQHQPIALQSAEIQLQLETGRLGEALCHELLHLHLFRLGFPLGEFVEIPFPVVYYARDLLGMCHWVLNVVQHELNYQNFIALGFDKSHFLFRSDEIIDYRQRFKSELQNGYPPEVDFPRWCIEYLRHFFVARHGGGGDFLDQAQDALAWGSRLYPQLPQVTAKISKWFELAAFQDPSQYPGQVNSLLELMGIPKFTGWAKLEFSRLKKPIAIRLNIS